MQEYGSIGNILHAMKKERAVLRTEPYLGNPDKAPNEIAGFVLMPKEIPTFRVFFKRSFPYSHSGSSYSAESQRIQQGLGKYQESCRK